MRRLLYAYFFLLIFEGALRKWLLPSLSGPLLVIRDPILLAIYAMAFQRGAWPWNGWMLCGLGLAMASFAASLAVGCPLVITLFGLRADFWQMPLIFIMPAIFDREEVARIGRWMLLILPGMALLALLQFRAGPAHWLNVTTAGGFGGQSTQLFAAAGRVRPSGTFSFVTGMVSCLALGSAFILDAFLERRATRGAWLAAAALILALGISGSRSAILYVGFVAAAGLLICVVNPHRVLRLVAPAIASAAVCAALLYGLADFRAGLAVNKDRFEEAGGLNEGILQRWVGDARAAWRSEQQAPLLGVGLGLGTSVGAGLATGTRQFLLAEGEWERAVLESGPVLGPAFILLRLCLGGWLLARAWRALKERGDPLPGLLLAAGLMDLTMGQWGQATVSGFAVFTPGLCLAGSMKEEPLERGEAEAPAAPRRMRGRGVYAAGIASRR